MTLRGTQPVRARPRLFHFPTVMPRVAVGMIVLEGTITTKF